MASKQADKEDIDNFISYSKYRGLLLPPKGRGGSHLPARERLGLEQVAPCKHTLKIKMVDASGIFSKDSLVVLRGNEVGGKLNILLHIG